MRPIDDVLARLPNAKPNGRDRWRSVCPACGGTNPSVLSIGLGHDDAVLVRCFKGCSADQVVDSLGLRIADLFPTGRGPRDGTAPLRRRAMLTMRQAIELIEFEVLLVCTAAFNLTNGHALTPDDLDRLAVAGRVIQETIDEVRA